MGNDVKCNVVGSSTMQIKTHDDTVRNLTNFYYISYLKRNLISLCTLESNDCRYSAEGGVLKVSKGAFVLMKGVRCDSLYILQGSTVKDTAVVTTSLSNDLTQLSHACLGTMSDNCMAILSKRGLAKVQVN